MRKDFALISFLCLTIVIGEVSGTTVYEKVKKKLFKVARLSGMTLSTVLRDAVDAREVAEDADTLANPDVEEKTFPFFPSILTLLQEGGLEFLRYVDLSPISVELQKMKDEFIVARKEALKRRKLVEVATNQGVLSVDDVTEEPAAKNSYWRRYFVHDQ